MAKKTNYRYLGENYRQLGLETGDILAFKPKANPDGSVDIKVRGASDRRKYCLHYKSIPDFKKRWEEVPDVDLQADLR